MRIYLIIVCLLASSMNMSYAEEKSNVLLLDTSENMRHSIDGQHKLNLVKMALSDVIQFWPQGEKLAVLSYQSQHECNGFDTKNASKKPLTQVQLAQLSNGDSNTKQQFPLLNALARAKGQLLDQQGNIILIAAASNPCHTTLSCNIVKKIKQNNPDIFIHTIDMQGNNATLQCIAKLSGGKYVSVFDILKLSQVIRL